ncbi:hypothetical protein D3C73_532030 [compost metagenome]
MLDIASVAERADRLLVAGDLTPARAEIDIGALDLRIHVCRGDAVGVELCRVEGDAHFPVRPAVAVDTTDTGLALKVAGDRVVDEPGQLLQRHVGRGDGEGLDRLSFDIDLGDDRFLDAGRQVAADLVDLVLGVLHRLFCGLFDAEDDRRERLAVGHGRLDLVDAADRGDGVLDLLRHLHFEFSR